MSQMPGEDNGTAMFQGFSEETIQFLWGVKFNNERGWFNEHKQEYLDHLYRPMQELGREVYDLFHACNPGCQLNLHVARIYRDARRVKYGGPYKDHLWLSMERPHDSEEDWHGIPSFWFEIGSTGYQYGLGYWGNPQDMEVYRRRILREPEKLEALVNLYESQETFHLYGEEYKRPKGQVAERLMPWFNRKYVGLSCEREPDELLFSPELAHELVKGYQLLMPFYEYFDSLRLEPLPE